MLLLNSVVSFLWGSTYYAVYLSLGTLHICTFAFYHPQKGSKASISAHMLSAEYERLVEIKMIQTSKPTKLQFVMKARRIGLRCFLAVQIEKMDRQNLNKSELEESSVYWKYKFSHSWNQHMCVDEHNEVGSFCLKLSSIVQ